ncbi:MAG: hypothetical protein HY543_08945 [Deltaproteobacteria bacterium]|nr:hypothetical protein [Deltaproteobacteria bacterium]
MMQELIAIIIVGMAGWYVARSLRREWRKYTTGCAHCALAKLRKLI